MFPQEDLFPLSQKTKQQNGAFLLVQITGSVTMRREVPHILRLKGEIEPLWWTRLHHHHHHHHHHKKKKKLLMYLFLKNWPLQTLILKYQGGKHFRYIYFSCVYRNVHSLTSFLPGRKVSNIKGLPASALSFLLLWPRPHPGHSLLRSRALQKPFYPAFGC